MGMHKRYGDTQIEVSVNRIELIARLKRNRDKHETEYLVAIKLWQEDLAKKISQINPTELYAFPNSLSELRSECPQSYITIYDDIIEMFEMGINETILLDSDSFKQFCKDDWDFQSDLAQNQYYKAARLKM